MPHIECRGCKQSLPETSFFRASKGKAYDKMCKPCKHVAQQARRKAFKQWCVDYKGGKCIVCGYNKCNSALDFHHLDPSQKEFGFSSKKGIMSKEKAIPELNKCVLLCRNCHSEVHAGVTVLPPET